MMGVNQQPMMGFNQYPMGNQMMTNNPMGQQMPMNNPMMQQGQMNAGFPQGNMGNPMMMGQQNTQVNQMVNNQNQNVINKNR